MRFIISVIESQARPPHTPEEMKAIDDFNDKIEDAGHRLFVCGLDSPDKATVFDSRNGSEITFPGPHHSSAEYISGFWVVKVDSIETVACLGTLFFLQVQNDNPSANGIRNNFFMIVFFCFNIKIRKAY